MNFFESLTSKRTVLWVAAMLSIIVIYPNINEMLWMVLSPVGSYHHRDWGIARILFFIYRYLFFVGLIWTLIRFNIRSSADNFKQRFGKSFGITLFAYLIYILIGYSVGYKISGDCFTRLVILQFVITWLITVLIGHIYNLIVIQREKELEIERLRTENLQSQVDALSNQINPHFFFNSLNGLTALVAAKRNEETLEYVAKLSNIFRYILQSDKKGLVKLGEELDFLEAYRYLIGIRYSGKITFLIEVNESEADMELPVLSLLPLIENIVKHNIIDSDHRMTVKMYTLGTELAVTNTVHRKYDVEGSTGIGLRNLSSRYKLLMGSDIRIIEENYTFTVILPLKRTADENTDR